MKFIITAICLFLTIGSIYSQERYLTKTGKINFFSETPIENITADNNQVLSIIDVTSGKMAISILMKSFLFEKALMQEHFNENYVESDKYPKSTFKGTIEDFQEIGNTEKEVLVKGLITIHGVSKNQIVKANITKSKEAILVEGEFIVNLDDFDVEIPSVVSKKIAKEIKITFNLNHKPYNK